MAGSISKLAVETEERERSAEKQQYYSDDEREMHALHERGGRCVAYEITARSDAEHAAYLSRRVENA